MKIERVYAPVIGYCAAVIDRDLGGRQCFHRTTQGSDLCKLHLEGEEKS